MPKSPGQKLKLLYLARILLEQTDENHPMTVREMLAALAEHGIRAERKSIYEDLEALRTFGLDVVCRRSRVVGYFVGGRQFQLAELKLLVDAVQGSRFITRKKSDALIRKLESLASTHEARQLQRQVFVAGRVKTMNESIYYTVDRLHEAISDGRKIRFSYFDWGVDGEKHLRRNGKRYEVSPWALTWDNENYYLIAYDGEAGKIKHYRVDKMLDLRPTTEDREGAELFEAFDMADYVQGLFGMYGGERREVQFRMRDHLAGVVIDRFGRELSLRDEGGGWFSASVRVALSPQFFGWVFSFGMEIRLEGPEEVVAAYRDSLRAACAAYGL